MTGFTGQDVQRNHTDQEIDLGQLVRFVWRGRWRILAMAAVAVLATLAFYAARYLLPVYSSEYSIVVELSFPNADAGKYPNGQPFSVSDITASNVLQTVYRDLDLESYGMTLADFVRRVSVKPYAVTGDFIDQRYKSKLQQKNLSAAEIQAIEAEYEQALKQSANRFAQISLLLSRNSAIPDGVAEKILYAIPAAWSEISIRNRGVLDVTLASAAALDTGRLSENEYAIALQRLREYSRHLADGLGLMIKNSMLRVIRDPETGMLPSDLVKRIDDLIRYQILPLQMEVTERGIVRNRDLAEVYFLSKLQDMKDKRDEALRKAAIYATATRSLQENAGVPGSGSSEASMNGIPVSVEYLDRMLTIGSELSETEFRQKLITRQTEILVEAEEYASQITELERQLAALKNAGNVGNVAVEIDTRIAEAVSGFEEVKRAYAGMVEEAREITLGLKGALYRPMSVEMSVYDPLAANLKKTLLLLLLAAFLGGALGVIFHLVAVLLKPVSVADAAKPVTDEDSLGASEHKKHVAGVAR